MCFYQSVVKVQNAVCVLSKWPDDIVLNVLIKDEKDNLIERTKEYLNTQLSEPRTY